jgi:hypothetical protein
MLGLPEFLNQFEVARAGHEEGSTKWHLLSSGDVSASIGFTGNFFLVFIDFEGEEFDWRQVANHLHLRVGRGPEGSIGVLIRFAVDYKDRFGQFIREVIENCSADESPEDTVLRILPRWFAFWDEPAPPLELIERIGMFGELVILNELMESTNGRVVGTWMSPQKNDDLHDFQGSSCHLEVKTTASSPRSITIHSINQMDFRRAANNDLRLIVVEIHRDEGGISLPDLIRDVRLESDNHEARSDLDDLLVRYGYHDRHQAFYHSDRYSIDGILHMRVDSETRIYTRSDLRENYEPTVVRLKQVVDPLELPLSELDDSTIEEISGLL